MSEDFNVQPINQKPVPVGTPQEAEDNGLDPTVYATCAKPNPVTGLVGCPHYALCVVSAKGKSGPRNYGVRIIKGQSQGGGLTTTTGNCMWIAQYANQFERNGGSVSVVAEEGETFDKVTRVAVNNQTGEVETNKWNKDVHREDRRIRVLVEPWPRPGQNKELLTDLLRAEVKQADDARRKDENLARSLGNTDAVAPLDKRDAGRHGRGKEKA